MAIVKNAFMSISASGSVGGVLTVKHTDQRQIMCAKITRMSQASSNQSAVRQRMRDASKSFVELSDADLRLWGFLGEKRRSNAWTVYFQEYQAQSVQAPAVPLIPSTWV